MKGFSLLLLIQVLLLQRRCSEAQGGTDLTLSFNGHYASHDIHMIYYVASIATSGKVLKMQNNGPGPIHVEIPPEKQDTILCSVIDTSQSTWVSLPQNIWEVCSGLPISKDTLNVIKNTLRESVNQNDDIASTYVSIDKLLDELFDRGLLVQIGVRIHQSRLTIPALQVHQILLIIMRDDRSTIRLYPPTLEAQKVASFLSNHLYASHAKMSSSHSDLFKAPRA